MDVAVRSSRSLISVQGKVLLLPLHLAKLWLMGALNLVLSLFHLLGMMPSEYANRVKIAELNRHIDSMHAREDEYRRRLEAVSQQLEAQSRDKGRAMKKLQRARGDVTALSHALDEVQDAGGGDPGLTGGEGYVGGGDGGGFAHNAMLTHAILWGAVLSVYLASRSASALELKLLLTIIIPVALMYFMAQTSPTRSWQSVTIQCVSAGVLGFTVNHLVC